MASDKDHQDAAELLDLQVQRNGVAVASVSDGTVFTFRKATLQALMDKNPTSDQVVIFVQHRTAKDGN
jgi:hypothetical protein